MKIALLTNFLYPERIGGTELYCHQLAQALIRQNHEVYWMVPNFASHRTITEMGESGLNIIRFAAVEEGEKSNSQFPAASFIREMKNKDIKVAHFNEIGGFEGVSGHLITAAKTNGIFSVVTLHLVHYLCMTGNLRFGGYEKCNGEVIAARCASCVQFSGFTGSKKLNHLLAKFFAGVFDKMNRSRIGTISRFSHVMDGFKTRLNFIENLRNDADVIVSLTNWFREMLIVNGVAAEKIVYMPQATPLSSSFDKISVATDRKGYVFIGRINKEKGLRLILKAARKLLMLNRNVKIDLFGPVNDKDEVAVEFMQEIDELSNIRYHGTLAPDQVLSTINRYKAVLLPSLVAEMAPLSIMEANKLHVPVIASDVPGSAELINAYDTGILFTYDSVDSLVASILKIEEGNCQFAFTQPAMNDFNDIAQKYLKVYSHQRDLLSVN